MDIRAKPEILRCNVIKYRRSDYVLYPLGRDKEKIKPLHGKEAYAIIIAEERLHPY